MEDGWSVLVGVEFALILTVLGLVLVRDARGLRSRSVQYTVRSSFPRPDTRSPCRWLGINDRDAYARSVNRTALSVGWLLLAMSVVLDVHLVAALVSAAV